MLGRLVEAIEIAGLLDRNTEEIGSVLRALNGEYILPEAGGDLLRDGAGVLPTGTLLQLSIRFSDMLTVGKVLLLLSFLVCAWIYMCFALSPLSILLCGI